MIKDYISHKIRENLPYTPNSDQDFLINLLGDFISEPSSDKLLLVKGYAGTGKTSLTGSLVKTLAEIKYPVILLAPTGRAAKVFSNYSGQPAYTIHKKIYRQKSFGNQQSGFAVMPNLHKDTLFIVDEASMISNSSGENTVFGSGRLLDDLIEYVYSEQSCRMILLGDTAQLPPVGQSDSPALQAEVLRSYGLEITECTLRQVARQNMESGILYNATKLREQIEERVNLEALPRFRTSGFEDFICIDGTELPEIVSECYDRDGIEETLLITRSNKRACLFNQGIRARVLYREEELSNGDLLMITKNNYFWSKEYDEIPFIANGEMAEVIRVRNSQSLYGFRFTDATIRLLDQQTDIDTKVILETLHTDTPSLSNIQQNNLFEQVMEDYSTLTTRGEKIRKIKEDPYFNALQIKYAYATTCHKAQGGQWKNVIIDLGNIRTEYLGIDFYRWLYTSVTRATQKVFLLNISDEMKENGL